MSRRGRLRPVSSSAPGARIALARGHRQGHSRPARGTRIGGLVRIVAEPADAEDVPGYRLAASAMRWRAGDGTRAYHDQFVFLATRGRSTHQSILRRLHRGVAAGGQGSRPRAHGAGAPTEREERENRFRSGELPVLFLADDGAQSTSPSSTSSTCGTSRRRRRTMRSGVVARAAPGSQLVFNYCAAGNSHDQYFRRPTLMVSGQVEAATARSDERGSRPRPRPRRLAGRVGSLARFVVSGDPRSRRRGSDVPSASRSASSCPIPRSPARPTARRAHSRGSRISTTPSGTRKPGSTRHFTAPCSRSIAPVTAGAVSIAPQSTPARPNIILDQSRSPPGTWRAVCATRPRPRSSSSAAEGAHESDFYSYRYFARGPPPRLQLSTASALGIYPARRARQGRGVPPPRFLAISEFGPRSIVYHEGSRYLINRVFLLPRERRRTGCRRRR